MADQGSGKHDRRQGPNAARVAARAREHIGELTGKGVLGVTSVAPAENGGWAVEVDVVEDRRVPSSSDMLATYAVDLDHDGDLVSYRRVRRYLRGLADQGRT
ncbi:MAG: gas vesicle protein [Saccharothrix sp.]|nr:gas vesicle protein [Saccharothrix sp.]